MKRSAIVVALAVLASGCLTTKAQTPIERPALEVPPVPPRLIEAAPPPELPMPEPVPELAPEKVIPSASAKPLRASPRELGKDAAKPEPPKPDPPPAEPPPVTQPAPPLRTPATADTAAADRRIRDMLTRTQTALNNIDYKRLKAPGQDAYDQAKSSIEGAEAALKALNFELAQQMADKAEKLAKELQAR
jgi:hypothetical protein